MDTGKFRCTRGLYASSGQEDEAPIIRAEAYWAKLLYLVCGTATVLFTIGLLFVIGVMRPSAKPPVPVQQAQPTPLPVLYDPLLDERIATPVPFGARARVSCAKTCPVSDMNCLRSCDKLLTAEFARRILLVDPSPAEAAREIDEACQALAAPAVTQLQDAQWKARFQDTLSSLNGMPFDEPLFQGSVAVQKYRVLEQHRERLRLPKDTALVKSTLKLQRVLCLRQSLALTQLAVFQSGRALDTYSERFYREVDASLAPKAAAVQTELKAEAVL